MSVDGPYPPGHRTGDHETSKAADRMVNAARPSMLYRMLRAYQYVDRTDEEAAQRMELLDSCYWKRANELRQLGFIIPTGDTRKGRKGTARIVCAITEEGKDVLRRRQLKGQP